MYILFTVADNDDIHIAFQIINSAKVREIHLRFVIMFFCFGDFVELCYDVLNYDLRGADLFDGVAAKIIIALQN